MLENGLRKSDVHREVESIGGLKYDYLISYGLFGPIVIELRLMHNAEIQNKTQRQDYKAKLQRYLASNTNNGVYAVFQVHDEQAQVVAYNARVEEYRDVKGLEIISFKYFEDTPAIGGKKTAKTNKKNAILSIDAAK